MFYLNKKITFSAIECARTARKNVNDRFSIFRFHINKILRLSLMKTMKFHFKENNIGNFD